MSAEDTKMKKNILIRYDSAVETNNPTLPTLQTQSTESKVKNWLNTCTDNFSYSSYQRPQTSVNSLLLSQPRGSGTDTDKDNTAVKHGILLRQDFHKEEAASITSSTRKLNSKSVADKVHFNTTVNALLFDNGIAECEKKSSFEKKKLELLAEKSKIDLLLEKKKLINKPSGKSLLDFSHRKNANVITKSRLNIKSELDLLDILTAEAMKTAQNPQRNATNEQDGSRSISFNNIKVSMVSPETFKNTLEACRISRMGSSQSVGELRGGSQAAEMKEGAKLVRVSIDSNSSTESKRARRKLIAIGAPMSPESRKKNELCTYLQLMDLKHPEIKNGVVYKNRRSTRVKNLQLLSEKRELERKLSKEAKVEDNEDEQLMPDEKFNCNDSDATKDLADKENKKDETYKDEVDGEVKPEQSKSKGEKGKRISINSGKKLNLLNSVSFKEIFDPKHLPKRLLKNISDFENAVRDLVSPKPEQRKKNVLQNLRIVKTLLRGNTLNLRKNKVIYRNIGSMPTVRTKQNALTRNMKSLIDREIKVVLVKNREITKRVARISNDSGLKLNAPGKTEKNGKPTTNQRNKIKSNLVSKSVKNNAKTRKAMQLRRNIEAYKKRKERKSRKSSDDSSEEESRKRKNMRQTRLQRNWNENRGQRMRLRRNLNERPVRLRKNEKENEQQIKLRRNTIRKADEKSKSNNAKPKIIPAAKQINSRRKTETATATKRMDSRRKSVDNYDDAKGGQTRDAPCGSNGDKKSQLMRIKDMIMKANNDEKQTRLRVNHYERMLNYFEKNPTLSDDNNSCNSKPEYTEKIKTTGMNGTVVDLSSLETARFVPVNDLIALEEEKSPEETDENSSNWESVDESDDATKSIDREIVKGGSLSWEESESESEEDENIEECAFIKTEKLLDDIDESSIQDLHGFIESNALDKRSLQESSGGLNMDASTKVEVSMTSIYFPVKSLKVEKVEASEQKLDEEIYENVKNNVSNERSIIENVIELRGGNSDLEEAHRENYDEEQLTYESEVKGEDEYLISEENSENQSEFNEESSSTTENEEPESIQINPNEEVAVDKTELIIENKDQSKEMKSANTKSKKQLVEIIDEEHDSLDGCSSNDQGPSAPNTLLISQEQSTFSEKQFDSEDRNLLIKLDDSQLHENTRNIKHNVLSSKIKLNEIITDKVNLLKNKNLILSCDADKTADSANIVDNICDKDVNVKDTKHRNIIVDTINVTTIINRKPNVNDETLMVEQGENEGKNLKFCKTAAEFDVNTENILCKQTLEKCTTQVSKLNSKRAQKGMVECINQRFKLLCDASKETKPESKICDKEINVKETETLNKRGNIIAETINVSAIINRKQNVTDETLMLEQGENETNLSIYKTAAEIDDIDVNSENISNSITQVSKPKSKHAQKRNVECINQRFKVLCDASNEAKSDGVNGKDVDESVYDVFSVECPRFEVEDDDGNQLAIKRVKLDSEDFLDFDDFDVPVGAHEILQDSENVSLLEPSAPEILHMCDGAEKVDETSVPKCTANEEIQHENHRSDDNPAISDGVDKEGTTETNVNDKANCDSNIGLRKIKNQMRDKLRCSVDSPACSDEGRKKKRVNKKDEGGTTETNANDKADCDNNIGLHNMKNQMRDKLRSCYAISDEEVVCKKKRVHLYDESFLMIKNHMRIKLKNILKKQPPSAPESLQTDADETQSSSENNSLNCEEEDEHKTTKQGKFNDILIHWKQRSNNNVVGSKSPAVSEVRTHCEDRDVMMCMDDGPLHQTQSRIIKYDFGKCREEKDAPQSDFTGKCFEVVKGHAYRESLGNSRSETSACSDAEMAIRTNSVQPPSDDAIIKTVINSATPESPSKRTVFPAKTLEDIEKQYCNEIFVPIDESESVSSEDEDLKLLTPNTEHNYIQTGETTKEAGDSPTVSAILIQLHKLEEIKRIVEGKTPLEEDCGKISIATVFDNNKDVIGFEVDTLNNPTDTNASEPIAHVEHTCEIQIPTEQIESEVDNVLKENNRLTPKLIEFKGDAIRNDAKSLRRNLLQNKRKSAKIDVGKDEYDFGGEKSEKKSSHTISVDEADGVVLDAYYFDYNLIVTQDLLVSFWTQSPLGFVLEAQNMWIHRGAVQRLALDSTCVRKVSKECITCTENSFAYVELWTKEHKSDKRERPVADVFAVIYFWRNRLNAPEKKFLQLENIKGFADDVQFVVLKNTATILVSWRIVRDNTTSSIIHCYQLANDFQTVVSIKEMESVDHTISSLHNIEDCDTLVMGCGEKQVTIWNLEFGFIVSTIDTTDNLPDPTSLWVKCDRGFLFLLQKCSNIFKLIAINGINQSWKRLKIYKPPMDFENFCGICIENGVLIAFYDNGILCWNVQTGDLLMEELCAELKFLPSNKHIVTRTPDNTFQVKNALSFLITNYDFSES